MRQYIVDAFTHRIFSGNQAAVCILEEWLPEDVMMNITLENNFSETAFAVKEGERYHLRWFTPGGEIDLCGHATLATGFTLLTFYEKQNTLHDVFGFAAQRKPSLVKLERAEPSLESLFMEVTGK